MHVSMRVCVQVCSVYWLIMCTSVCVLMCRCMYFMWVMCSVCACMNASMCVNVCMHVYIVVVFLCSMMWVCAYVAHVLIVIDVYITIEIWEVFMVKHKLMLVDIIFGFHHKLVAYPLPYIIHVRRLYTMTELLIMSVALFCNNNVWMIWYGRGGWCSLSILNHLNSALAFLVSHLSRTLK